MRRAASFSRSARMPASRSARVLPSSRAAAKASSGRGQHLGLDRLDRAAEGHGAARQAGVGMVGGVDHGHVAVLAGADPGQGLVEGRQVALLAQDELLVGDQRAGLRALAALVRQQVQGQVVAVDGRASGRFPGGAGLAQALQHLGDVAVGHLDRAPAHLDAGVVAGLDLGLDLDRQVDLQGSGVARRPGSRQRRRPGPSAGAAGARSGPHPGLLAPARRGPRSAAPRPVPSPPAPGASCPCGSRASRGRARPSSAGRRTRGRRPRGRSPP